MHAFRSSVVLIGFLIARPVLAVLAQQYTVTDLGGSASAAMIPRAINSSGQIAGYTVTRDTRAWLWTDGEAQNLGMLPDTASCYAMGLNDAGQLVGSCFGSQVGRHSVIWTPDGGVAALDLPASALPWAINNNGDIVGQFSVADRDHAFVYRGGAFSDLGPGLAQNINDAGQAVEFQWIDNTTHALLWDDDGAHDLGSLSGGDSVATSISADGVVAGGSRESAVSYHAVAWTPYGIANLGGVCARDTSSASTALGIAGSLIVGLSSCGGSGRAFLYDLNGPGYPVDLNDLIPPDSGWVLTLARGVNAAGLIVGEGVLNGESGHAFLLTPIATAPR